MAHPELRASDDDRRRVVSALERHTAAGRLSLDEFSERVGLAYAAATHGELAGITRDLPDEQPATGHGATDHTGQRQLLGAFLVAAVVIAVLALAFALLR